MKYTRGDFPKIPPKIGKFLKNNTRQSLTAMALGQLVSKGKLRWDQPLVQLVPELRFADSVATERATVDDCLLHRTGLPSGNCRHLRIRVNFSDACRTFPVLPGFGRRASIKICNSPFLARCSSPVALTGTRRCRISCSHWASKH